MTVRSRDMTEQNNLTTCRQFQTFAHSNDYQQTEVSVNPVSTFNTS